MAGPGRETEAVQQRQRGLVRLVAGHAGHQQRHSDVLLRGELTQQIMELINEADAVPPDQRPLCVRQPADSAPIYQDLSAIRLFQQPGCMQQSGFSGPGRRHQRHDLTSMQRQIHTAQHR